MNGRTLTTTKTEAIRKAEWLILSFLIQDLISLQLVLKREGVLLLHNLCIIADVYTKFSLTREPALGYSFDNLTHKLMLVKSFDFVKQDINPKWEVLNKVRLSINFKLANN